MRLLLAAVICCITAATVYCQRGPTPYYEDTNNVPVSPGCGTEDPGYNGVKAMDDLPTNKNVKHVWNESGGGHSWPNWQVYLSKYGLLLFRE